MWKALSESPAASENGFVGYISARVEFIEGERCADWNVRVMDGMGWEEEMGSDGLDCERSFGCG